MFAFIAKRDCSRGFQILKFRLVTKEVNAKNKIKLVWASSKIMIRSLFTNKAAQTIEIITKANTG